MVIGIDLRSLAGGKHSGVEEYVRGLLGELVRQGAHHQFILFFNAWGRQEPDFSFVAGLPNVQLKRFHIPNILLNFCLWYLSFPKLDRLIGGVDVFFMPNMNFAAVSKRSRLWVTVHDLSFEWFPETFSWKQRVWHYMVNLRGLLVRADRIIAVSQSTADDVVRRYALPRERLSVMASGVASHFHPIDRNSIVLLETQKKYALPYRFILSLGTLEPRKNLLSLLQAYEAFHQEATGELTKYDLVIAGAPGWKCEEFLSAVRSSPVRHHVHLLGFVDEADKPALYTLASVFVYPSFYEGFGFPPLEAAACGTPVITSHSSSLPEVISSAGVLIDPYRPDEIRLALRELLSDRAIGEELRHRAMEVRTRFTWRGAAEQWLQSLTETTSR